MELFTLKSSTDGLHLSCAMCRPEGEIKGIVQFSHGMAEHKERYFDFMNYLADRGYLCVIHDHRGHGGSVKSKDDLGYFYAEGTYAIINDLYQVMEHVKALCPGKPYTLFGHSMGVMVVTCLLKTGKADVDKVVLSGAPTKNPMAGLGVKLVKAMIKSKGDRYRSTFVDNMAFSAYNKAFKVLFGWICSDEQVVDEYIADELCGYLFTLNGFLNLFSLLQQTHDARKVKIRSDVPVLFVAGEEDPVIQSREKLDAFARFYKDSGADEVTYKLYAGMRHEILNERDKEKVYEDIAQFIAR